jgi:DMSO/TMAO reductase YedYZ molybdopterin-dependent catalytic subunit
MTLDSTDGPSLGRRAFLKIVAGLSLVLGLPRVAWGLFVKHFPVRTVEEADFDFDPVLGQVLTQGQAPHPYRLVVDGLVEAPVELPYQQLRAWPQVEQVSDFHCVEGWSVADVKWSGFRFSEIMKQVAVKPEAKYVVFHSLGQTGSKPDGQDHYLESFPLERLLNPQAEILMVLDMDQQPLPLEHGAPLRVISPYDLAYKSIKFVTRVEFTAKAKPGWWTLANPIYPIDAPVPETRLRKK